MQTADIRQQFIDFFAERGHRHVPSSPLVPGNDPTLLFTNSGMVQFKEVFLGADKRPYQRAVTAQRCLRAGGKHNDLENVGFTARHHTFFEMLGNFSFGDYFKEQAIEYAWEFLTSSKYLGLKKEHLWVTVFGGGNLFDDSPAVPADEESYNQWLTVLQAAGFSEEQARARITRIHTADNFWMMGDTGPCGPCSEIFYDTDGQIDWFRGETPEYADNCVEIWNLVFMQYNRDESGTLNLLPAPCVDTGMGLERISTVMQSVESNYDIDLFRQLLQAVSQVVGWHPQKPLLPSHRVIADHIRAATLMIADGIMPSNEGRGYVLRRIIRRALRHVHELNPHIAQACFYRLVEPMAVLMGEAFPIINERRTVIENCLKQEEESFTHLLKNGVQLLNKTIANLKATDNGTDGAKVDGAKVLSGEVIFKLYDTFGFPPDMTANIAKEHNLIFDEEGYLRAMQEQRHRSKEADSFSAVQKTVDYNDKPTEFLGYTAGEAEATVLAIYVDGQAVPQVMGTAENVLLVLDRTPFYGESGGQVGDTGWLDLRDSNALLVQDTQKLRTDVWQHVVTVSEGTVAVGDVVYCRVDVARRQSIARAHSATHLLHAALRQRLGVHVQQRGSFVSADSIRFDFSHHQGVSWQELNEIESIINSVVAGNVAVETAVMPYDDALKLGAMALFGEKYGDTVRVVTMDPEFSVELCGGTHVGQTGNIGAVTVVGEAAIASGVRRIEAVTATKSVALNQSRHGNLHSISQVLKTPVEQLPDKITQLRATLKESQKQVEKLQAEKIKHQAADLVAMAQNINDTPVLIARVEGMDEKGLRDLAKGVCQQLSPAGVVLLGMPNNTTAFYIAVTGKKSPVDANQWLQSLQSVSGASGGGKANFAQAGGGTLTQIATTLQQARDNLSSYFIPPNNKEN